MPPAPHPLRIAAPEPLTVDPGLASELHSDHVIVQLFAGLVEQTESLEIVPDVATHWEIENGGRTYIFHLRPDARWSDGVQLTAYDFEFAWKRVLAPETKAPLASLFYDVKGAQAYNRLPGAGRTHLRRRTGAAGCLLSLYRRSGGGQGRSAPRRDKGRRGMDDSGDNCHQRAFSFRKLAAGRIDGADAQQSLSPAVPR